MPPTTAVLADGVLIPVAREDHLVRQVGGHWVCVRPRHDGRPCSVTLAAVGGLAAVSA